MLFARLSLYSYKFEPMKFLWIRRGISYRPRKTIHCEYPTEVSGCHLWMTVKPHNLFLTRHYLLGMLSANSSFPTRIVQGTLEQWPRLQSNPIWCNAIPPAAHIDNGHTTTYSYMYLIYFWSFSGQDIHLTQPNYYNNNEPRRLLNSNNKPKPPEI